MNTLFALKHCAGKRALLIKKIMNALSENNVSQSYGLYMIDNN